jgi:hypothetical protein
MVLQAGMAQWFQHNPTYHPEPAFTCVHCRPLHVYTLPAAHCLGLLPSICVMQVTHNVACLARWMAADLYLREVDVLRFEVIMFHNSAWHILSDKKRKERKRRRLSESI